MAAATETRTDTQIQTDVLAELKFEPRVQPNEIGVVVKDGVGSLNAAAQPAAPVCVQLTRARCFW